MALLNNEKKNIISASVVPFRTFNCFHVCGDVFVSFLFLNLRDCKLVV